MLPWGLRVDIEHRLSDVLSEFARTMVTDFPIQAILDHLVVRIVDVLPITAAGVTLISPGADPHYIAASDEAALRFERLQTELGEGPCLAAYGTGEAVSVPDLRVDDAVPGVRPRALAAGLAAVFTFPLRQGDDALGRAGPVPRRPPGRWTPAAMAAAQTLADVAAAYLLNAQARDDLRGVVGAVPAELAARRADRAAQPGAAASSGSSTRSLRGRRSQQDGGDPVRRPRPVQGGQRHLRPPRRRRAARSPSAGRLTGLLRPGDTLARMSGDEFVVLCEDLDDAAQVEPSPARIGAALADPVRPVDRRRSG